MARANALLKAAVVDERHASGEVHKHFALLADKPFLPNALQNHLRKKHGINVHFSATHDFYWTTFVYLTVPGEGPDQKKLEDLDADPWLTVGHPPVREELLNIPRGARKCDKLRVQRFLGAGVGGGGVEEHALSFEEFTAELTEKGLRSRQALLAWITRHKVLPTQATPPKEDKSQEAQEVRGANDTAVRLMDEAKQLNAFVHKHMRDLNDRIHLAWELHDAVADEERAALSAWETVLAAPAKYPCVCGGAWIPLTEDMLRQHVAVGQQKGVDPEELPYPDVVRAAVRKALREGCSKHTNVFFVGPPNAAKTHVVAPLVAIFGKDSFRRPLGKTNFPMMSIHGKKVCVLEDLRPGTFGLGWDALLVWWEGQALPVPMPQNHHRGPKDYLDAAPCFATGGEKLRIPLREAMEQMVDPAVQNEMMDKRWVYFCFSQTFNGAARKVVRACPHCFTEWLTAPAAVLPEATGAGVGVMEAPSAAAASAASSSTAAPFCADCGALRAATPFCAQTGRAH